MSKKILAALLAVLMVFSMLPLAAGAAALRGIAGSNHRNGAMTWQEECE